MVRIVDLSRELGISVSKVIALAKSSGLGIVSNREYLTSMAADRVRFEMCRRLSSLPNGRIRVGSLAEELNTTTVEVLSLCNSMSISASRSISILTSAEAARIRSAVDQKSHQSETPTTTVMGDLNLVEAEDLSGDLEYGRTEYQVERLTQGRWPTVGDYDNALLNIATDFVAERLKEMELDSLDINSDSPIYSSGAFACVARVTLDGETWALRMFVRDQNDLVARYRAIRVKQDLRELPECFVPVEFLRDAVRVEIDQESFSYPVVLIKWINGLTLTKFVARAHQHGAYDDFKMLASALRDLRSQLYGLQVAHGDLSPDNMIVESTAAGLSVRLLDYDSLWFPEVCNLECSVSADGEFQHPGRANPIGAYADQVAFEMYDVVLRFLGARHTVEDLQNLFDQRILLNRIEWMTASSELARLIESFDPESFARIGRWLSEPFEVHTREVDEMMAPRAGGDVSGSDITLDFDETAALLELSTGRFRLLIEEFGLQEKTAFSLDDIQTLEKGLLVENSLACSSTVDLESISAIKLCENFGLSMSRLVEICSDLGLSKFQGSEIVDGDSRMQLEQRIREDRDRYRHVLSKLCGNLGITQRTAVQRLAQGGLSTEIALRSYGWRVTNTGRQFLMRQAVTSNSPRSRLRGEEVVPVSEVAEASGFSLEDVLKKVSLAQGEAVFSNTLIPRSRKDSFVAMLREDSLEFPVTLLDLARITEFSMEKIGDVIKTARLNNPVWFQHNVRERPYGLQFSERTSTFLLQWLGGGGSPPSRGVRSRWFNKS